jgi:hypothetical protein
MEEWENLPLVNRKREQDWWTAKSIDVSPQTLEKADQRRSRLASMSRNDELTPEDTIREDSLKSGFAMQRPLSRKGFSEQKRVSNSTARIETTSRAHSFMA